MFNALLVVVLEDCVHVISVIILVSRYRCVTTTAEWLYVNIRVAIIHQQMVFARIIVVSVVVLCHKIMTNVHHVIKKTLVCHYPNCSRDVDFHKNMYCCHHEYCYGEGFGSSIDCHDRKKDDSHRYCEKHFEMFKYKFPNCQNDGYDEYYHVCDQHKYIGYQKNCSKMYTSSDRFCDQCRKLQRFFADEFK